MSISSTNGGLWGDFIIVLSDFHNTCHVVYIFGEKIIAK
jgi:hypothetical protein